MQHLPAIVLHVPSWPQLELTSICVTQFKYMLNIDLVEMLWYEIIFLPRVVDKLAPMLVRP